MLFTLGKIFFPTMLHRERELRAKMRWIAICFGVVLIGGIVALMSYVHQTRPQIERAAKPLQVQPR